ncbi:HesA/MoeB/ThiF family protein [Thermosediminibacter litoriperuensis]|uniref:Molybdopterin/thiamine biosynthesis adenylyltransferase n=1 Tax=Thermosediminibacter litoriperuensis TaxID=291989 RepID=A0A5S5AZ35_9FIRM|nr:HesA/MoeB/ThiF family protein [Thermosediminibacter litoriperuensis]TYP57624.1 molybdopterin/thiamine biosynthesis adenylyltransferase [Thermosediminibacter litoriperuensis]
MILPKEQVYRYLRHIIMPEISGPGQKKLIESTGLVVSSSLENASPLLYYLTASGIGRIYVTAEKFNQGFLSLKENLEDLNPDIKIEFLNDTTALPTGEKIDFAVFINNFKAVKHLKEIPAILAATRPWKGYIRTVKRAGLLDDPLPGTMEGESERGSAGVVFSRCFAGTICAIEAVKLCLNIGRLLEAPLYFDLYSMEFKTGEFINEFAKDDTREDPAERERLSRSKVLIVGTGGLGSPAALALTLAGVGTIGLVDSDAVEISNLNRQILHSTSRVGMLKVESAEAFLKKINPEVNVVKYPTRFDRENALEIIRDYDVIIDGVDNLPTRYLLNDACVLAGKPLAEAGVLRFEGLGMTVVPGEGPCYRCVFPKMPPPGSIPSCSETGVLGPVPGVMGSIEAAEAAKILTGHGKLLSGRLLIFDSMELDFKLPDLKRDPGCPVCGRNPSIRDLSGEYEFICEKTEKD